FVSLGSFGAAEVRRHGQAWFAHLCHDAGADGVEIRAELMTGAAGELASLAATLSGLDLDCVYSCPDMLWDEQGRLARDTLESALSSAAILGAGVLKMSIGGFRPDTAADTVPWLAERLAGLDIELLIENDQTGRA